MALNNPGASSMHLFIHSFGHFYSAPWSPLLLGGAPHYSTDIARVSEFHAEAHRQLQVKDLPKVPTWRLERQSNPRPSGWKSSSQPRRHHVPTKVLSMMHKCIMVKAGEARKRKRTKIGEEIYKFCWNRRGNIDNCFRGMDTPGTISY